MFAGDKRVVSTMTLLKEIFCTNQFFNNHVVFVDNIFEMTTNFDMQMKAKRIVQTVFRKLKSF